MAYVLLVNTELTKYFIDKYLSDLVKEDFFKDKYPNRIRSKWLNSTPVRRELANL